MNFMNVLVDRFVVHQAVVVVENYFVDHRARHEITQKLRKRWNRRDVDLIPKLKFPKKKDRDASERSVDDQLVEQNRLDGLEKLFAVNWIVGFWLDFVSFDEFRPLSEIED